MATLIHADSASISVLISADQRQRSACRQLRSNFDFADNSAIKSKRTSRMITGLCFVILGILILFYPQILVVMLATLLVLFGLGMMAASWQFRRVRKRSESRLVNWLIRY